jgi:hypothetical protein
MLKEWGVRFTLWLLDRQKFDAVGHKCDLVHRLIYSNGSHMTRRIPTRDEDGFVNELPTLSLHSQAPLSLRANPINYSAIAYLNEQSGI